MLLRQFVSQFDEYQGYLVYRKRSNGPPIRVTMAEKKLWTDEFESSLPKGLWRSFFAVMAIMFLVVGLDASKLIDIPDWLPIPLIMVMIVFFSVKMLRDMVKPAQYLSALNRPPMGGERSKEEAAEIAIKNLPWGGFIVSIWLGICGIILLFFIKPQIYTDYPWQIGLFICFIIYLFVGGIMAVVKKWKIHKKHDANSK